MTKIATNHIFDLAESSIPNAVLEQILYRVANGHNLEVYDSYEGKEDEMQLKTMYASKVTKKAMTILIEYYEKHEQKVFGLPEEYTGFVTKVKEQL